MIRDIFIWNSFSGSCITSISSGVISCLHGWFSWLSLLTFALPPFWGIILSRCLFLFNLSSSPHSPVSFSSCLHLASWWLHTRKRKSFVVGSEHPSPGGAIGDSFCWVPGVRAQKLWLLFLTSPGAQLGALPQALCRVWPSPCLVLVSVTWRWLSYFFITVMSFKFLFL